MSEDTIPNELETLKERATLMGIEFHPSIGLEKLKTKVNAVINGEPKEQEDQPVNLRATKLAAVAEARAEAGKLIRVNVVCMNPAKKEWPGEIFSVGNTNIGTFKKFVQFNTTEGYHIPKIIYELMRTKKFQIFKTERTVNGVAKRVGHLASEFAIEVLDQLTKEELADLAKAQAARG